MLSELKMSFPLPFVLSWPQKIGSFHKGYPAKNHPQARPAGWRALLAKWSFWQIVSPMHFGLLLLVFQFQKDSLQIFNRVRFFSQKKTSQPEPHKPHDSTIYINQQKKQVVWRKKVSTKTHRNMFPVSQVTPPTHLRPGCGGRFLSTAPPWSDHMVPWERFLETRIKPLGLWIFLKKEHGPGIFHVGVMDEIWCKWCYIWGIKVERIEIDLFFLKIFWVGLGDFPWFFALFLFENISDKRPCFVRKDV